MLEASSFVRKNLSWFIVNSLISKEASRRLDNEIDNLIKEVSEFAGSIVRGFNLPAHSLISPIYRGYQDYYSVDKTDGEFRILRGPIVAKF